MGNDLNRGDGSRLCPGLPDANHALDKGDPFKVIYGVEGYLVDDTKQLVENSKGQSFKDSYVVLT